MLRIATLRAFGIRIGRLSTHLFVTWHVFEDFAWSRTRSLNLQEVKPQTFLFISEHFDLRHEIINLSFSAYQPPSTHCLSLTHLLKPLIWASETSVASQLCPMASSKNKPSLDPASRLSSAEISNTITCNLALQAYRLVDGQTGTFHLILNGPALKIDEQKIPDGGRVS